MPPIKPENVDRYPADWADIRASILRRAGDRCEKCGAINHTWKPAASGVGVIYVCLTIAHLDHTPENCDPVNLRAWCQVCHLAYDREHHMETARKTRAARLGMRDLFSEVKP